MYDEIKIKIVTKITEVFTKDNIQISKKENSFKGNGSENKAPPNEFTSTIKNGNKTKKDLKRSSIDLNFD